MAIYEVSFYEVSFHIEGSPVLLGGFTFLLVQLSSTEGPPSATLPAAWVHEKNLRIRLEAIDRVDARVNAGRMAENFCAFLPLDTGEHVTALYRDLQGLSGAPDGQFEAVLLNYARVVSPARLSDVPGAVDKSASLATTLQEDDQWEQPPPTSAMRSCFVRKSAA